jgi:hypothetical protein
MTGRLPSLGRFAALELAVWASLYPAYLAIRGSSIDQSSNAFDHARSLIHIERATDLFHEADMQSALHPVLKLLSAYYLLGFGPVIAAVLVWLGIRRRDLYRSLRTLLLTSLGLAVIGYVAYPTAPPRLVPGLSIADSVGLSGHDHGSVAGIRFNPYAAMPSMHVGWSILIGYFGFRAARSRWLKAFFVAHPFLMVITVTATGNHYFVDAIGGALAVLLAAGIVAGLRRLRSRRHRDAGAEVIELGLAMPRIRPDKDDRRLAA